jgi:hypothetical protein
VTTSVVRLLAPASMYLPNKATTRRGIEAHTYPTRP